jgi:hypothetical protein
VNVWHLFSLWGFVWKCGRVGIIEILAEYLALAHQPTALIVEIIKIEESCRIL